METLQYVLLPRLSAVDLFRLGYTRQPCSTGCSALLHTSGWYDPLASACLLPCACGLLCALLDVTSVTRAHAATMTPGTGYLPDAVRL